MDTINKVVSMKVIKTVIRKIIGLKNVERLIILKKRIALKSCYSDDYRLYKKHSSVFKKDTYNKIESEITLRYHSIEKGFLHNNIRHRFAKARVEELVKLLRELDLGAQSNRAQVQSALLNLCNYYEYHLKENVDISDYFQKDEYNRFKRLILKDYSPIKHHTIESFFQNKDSDFLNFSISRASIRNFTGQKITTETIQKVVSLANHAPSVCNRQPVNVHLVENKLLIEAILRIQGGLKGYSDNLSQLILITSDRNYFYSVGERHQLYIDGGIYLMNLLYALHFHGIGACPAHWGMPREADNKVMKLICLKESEQIISIVAIGVPSQEFSTTLSLRKSYEENLFTHN